MKRIILILLSAVFLITLLSCSKQNKKDYPIPRDTQTASEETTEEPVIEDDTHYTSGYINVNIGSNSGFDLYKAPENLPGYRYGPSFIVYEDGSIDVWLASGGSGLEQWDWIVYRHYDGSSWSEEKCVLQPTPNSLDHYSCCDPGVIYLNGYYYLAYTSTLNENQGDNNLFVARSREPDGPYEKWNGNGWGGNKPMPIRYFSEDQSHWGIGEASFVELDGTLYIYYTVKGSSGNHTMVATADATDENWPATMEDQGIALENATCDALDVKYVDKYQRFLAVGAEKRLTSDSFLAFYESRDGITFTKTDSCKKNVYEFCHNPGMSGSENGHILEDRKSFVGYAYGPEWGVWNTRFQEFTYSYTDRIDLMEENASCIRAGEIPRDTSDSNSLEYVGISPQSYCTVRVPVSQKSMVLSLSACKRFHNEWINLHNMRFEVELYGYDENIIQRTGENSLLFNIVGVGETMVTAEFRGHLTYICVIVYEDGSEDMVTDFGPLATNVYEIDKGKDPNYSPQIKSILTYGDGSWEMIWATELHPISFSYDESALTVDQNGHIYPKKGGSHTVKVSYGTLSYTLTVNVITPDISEVSFEEDSIGIKALTISNNTLYEYTENGLMCTVTTPSDPYIILDMAYTLAMAKDYSSITFEYMIPLLNKGADPSAQIFFGCDDSPFTEEASQRVTLIRDGAYHKITLDLSDKSYWQGQISYIRIDYFETCEENDVFYLKTINFNSK